MNVIQRNGSSSGRVLCPFFAHLQLNKTTRLETERKEAKHYHF